MLLSKKIHKQKPKYQFGVKRIQKFNGEEILIPIFRKKTSFGWSKWEQIVKIYDTYRLMDFDGEINLTEEECINYCKEYKKVIDDQYSEEIQYSEIHAIDDNSINNLDESDLKELTKKQSKISSFFNFLNF